MNKSVLWNKLLDMAFDKKETDEAILWKDLYHLIENMEFEQEIHDACCIELKDEEMEVAIQLVRFSKEEGYNCFDCIGYIDWEKDSEKYIVGIFTEPLGIVGFQGDILTKLLENIFQLYQSQPKNISYIDAGHLLIDLFRDMGRDFDFDKDKLLLTDIWKSKS